MSKIIIDNRSDLPIDVAVEYVWNVIKMGRISNNDKQYCYLTVFDINGEKYQVSTDLRTKSDRFLIIKE